MTRRHAWVYENFMKEPTQYLETYVILLQLLHRGAWDVQCVKTKPAIDD